MTDQNETEDRALIDALRALPDEHPSTQATQFFHGELRASRRKVRVKYLVPIAAIAAIGLLAVAAGWWHDRAREEGKVEALQTALVAALHDLSAAKRFDAITAAGNAPTADAQIVAALTKSLLTDSSTNVRVAAAAALGRIATPTALRDAAAKSFASEPSPFVHTALLAATASLPPKERAALLRALLARPDIDPIVRAEAEAHNKS